MDTALLHAGATAATGGAGVAFSPVAHISINYEFIFLLMVPAGVHMIS